MRNLSPPKDSHGQALSARDVFDNCVSMVRDAALKARLTAIGANISQASASYDINAAAKTLFHEQPHGSVGPVSKDELVGVYENRMVKKKSKGRATYDLILSAPQHAKCPFCGIGTVNTLDHFLPKKKFPAFSVTPNNLVPACEWCQGEKLEYYPTTAGGQLLHPYFDSVDQDVWLAADVVQGSPASFRFFASPPANWSADARERVATHLRKLNLAKLFSSNAGSRLTEIRGRLTRLHSAGGANAVREHLEEELLSLEEDQKNSWTAAMYRGAIASNWFCNGGFK